MRRFLSFVMVMLISLSSFAQDVTKFLGIPVDGTKESMKQKLIQKGFKYDAKKDCLKGEFNGRDVEISIVTYRNKVWRIAVVDATPCDEAQIKVRFNNLCYQFNRNKKYTPVRDAEKYIIPDDEDISYEMSVNNKRYEASYIQNFPDIETEEGKSVFQQELLKKFESGELDPKSFENMSKEEGAKLLLDLIKNRFNNSVWFTINDVYLRYEIIMFYDNEANHNTDDDI